MVARQRGDAGGRGGEWFEANDAAVRLVPPDRVLAAQAYLLFYAPA